MTSQTNTFNHYETHNPITPFPYTHTKCNLNSTSLIIIAEKWFFIFNKEILENTHFKHVFYFMCVKKNKK